MSIWLVKIGALDGVLVFVSAYKGSLRSEDCVSLMENQTVYKKRKARIQYTNSDQSKTLYFVRSTHATSNAILRTTIQHPYEVSLANPNATYINALPLHLCRPPEILPRDILDKFVVIRAPNIESHPHHICTSNIHRGLRLLLVK